MSDTTDTLMVDLGTYVAELAAQRKAGNGKASRGSVIKIFVVIGKLRQIGEPSIESCIIKALEAAQLNFDSSGDYRNICWHCYREDGVRKFLVECFEKKCPECGWLICPECGSCCAPEFGGCRSSRTLSDQTGASPTAIP